MRFTHYMWYLVMLEGGKLIPVLGFFWRPLLHFYRGVSNTICSISWWWWSAHRVCPYSILHVAEVAFGEGLPTICRNDLSHFLTKFDHIFVPGTHDVWSRRGAQIESHRRPPPDPAEASKASTAAIRPSPEPSIIQPNTRSPACGFLLVIYVGKSRICNASF